LDVDYFCRAIILRQKCDFNIYSSITTTTTTSPYAWDDKLAPYFSRTSYLCFSCGPCDIDISK
jgi:hypothetical protein